MAAQNPPYVLQGATGINHPAELFRRMLRTATGGGTGIVGSGDLAVTQNGTPNMSVNVAKGEVLVAGSATVDQGTYYCFNDATVNLAISAADPTNPRIDLIVAKVTDTLSDADTWSLAVVAGTPAASPAAPAAPTNSFTLAQIAVAANATSIVSANITDKRTVLAFPGVQRIGKQVLGSSAASVIFSNIPAGFSHLQIVAQARGDTAANNVGLTVQFNGDTNSTNYAAEATLSKNSTVTAFQNPATNFVGDISAASASANVFGAVRLDIPNYASVSNQKNWQSETFLWYSGPNTWKENSGGIWVSTAAINSVTLLPVSGNLVANSVFALYGIP